MLIREKRNPRDKRDPLVQEKLDMLVRKDMLLREILLRERAVRKELSDSPNTSKRYGCASLEGSKRAKLRTIQYPSTFSSTFGKKEDFSYLRKTRSKRKKIVKGIVGREGSTISYKLPINRLGSRTGIVPSSKVHSFHKTRSK